VVRLSACAGTPERERFSAAKLLFLRSKIRHFNKKQNVSPEPEFPFGKVFQNNFQDHKTDVERYQQPNLGDFQRMLEADSTAGTITLPLHWTCPTWIHIYTHRQRASLCVCWGHPLLNQAKQNKAGYSLLKTTHQWV